MSIPVGKKGVTEIFLYPCREQIGTQKAGVADLADFWLIFSHRAGRRVLRLFSGEMLAQFRLAPIHLGKCWQFLVGKRYRGLYGSRWAVFGDYGSVLFQISSLANLQTFSLGVQNSGFFLFLFLPPSNHPVNVAGPEVEICKLVTWTQRRKAMILSKVQPFHDDSGNIEINTLGVV